MRPNPLSCFLLLALATLPACQPQEKPATLTDSTIQTPAIHEPIRRQLLLVTTAGWDSVQGTLTAYSQTDGKWQMALDPIPIVVGKNGMAWGRGTEDFRTRSGPVKREGDKRSPAGIFQLGSAFGYADAEAAKWVRMEYVPVKETTMCIEDTASAYYNQIVDESQTETDWNSTDHMLRKDELYEWGLFVAHNADEPEPGGGSCIFLHVWRTNDAGTAGCTAMEKKQLVRLLEWLDPKAAPTIVQVPRNEYPDLRKLQELPELR